MERLCLIPQNAIIYSPEYESLKERNHSIFSANREYFLAISFAGLRTCISSCVCVADIRPRYLLGDYIGNFLRAGQLHF